jgi:hypothetical protein
MDVHRSRREAVMATAGHHVAGDHDDESGSRGKRGVDNVERMPGLPKVSRASFIEVDDSGAILGV